MTKEDLHILCACEESQAVCGMFRLLGFDAWSCDLYPSSGGFPEYHIQGDVIPVMKSGLFNVVIAFPPCTHLTVAGARWWKYKQDGRQEEGIRFFMEFVNLDVPFKAIENPVGIMSKRYRKPDQIIHPYMFGEETEKRTCLWLFNLPKLTPTNIVGKGERVRYKNSTMSKWYSDAFRLPPEERSKVRSKTFIGIAEAMASQWGDYLVETIKDW